MFNVSKESILNDFTRDVVGKNNPKIGIIKQLANKLYDELNTITDYEHYPFKEDFTLDEAVAKYEVGLIRYALQLCNNHQRNAAKLLGVKVSTLNAKIKRYNISNKSLALSAQK